MSNVPLAYAFTLGLVAAVNPCGFPMLPAYLTFFIGTDGPDEQRGRRVVRALVASASVSVGFLAVFAGLGVPINAGVTSIYRVVPWLSIVIGVVLVGLGVATLLGRKPTMPVPRFARGGRERTVGSMALFGVSYAVASLGCTLPLFLNLVAGTARRENLVSGLLAFVAYGLGMALVLTVLALALALSRASLVRRMRTVLPYVDRLSGVLLVLVGAYLVYYWAFNLAQDPTDPVGSSPISFVEEWSTSATTWLSEGGVDLGLVLAVPVVVAIGWVLLRRRSLAER